MVEIGAELSASGHVRFTPGERAYGNRSVGVSVDPRAGTDAVFPLPGTGPRNFSRPSCNMSMRYPEFTVSPDIAQLSWITARHYQNLNCIALIGRVTCESWIWMKLGKKDWMMNCNWVGEKQWMMNWNGFGRYYSEIWIEKLRWTIKSLVQDSTCPVKDSNPASALSESRHRPKC